MAQTSDFMAERIVSGAAADLVRMKRIGVTGASGFIGTALVEALLGRGDQVIAFSRGGNLPASLGRARIELLDVTSQGCVPALAAALEGLDAVVHLAGETVAGRWS
ncbi:MAG: NAD-dependent epimerase/dehydratase family protein, partial [Candidatus Eremiobacteraeota bacterium]|nr:NAD-dependent epimerase/dehydratase family protein [Candidatus Eremiobacteraeota bacterium]